MRTRTCSVFCRLNSLRHESTRKHWMCYCTRPPVSQTTLCWRPRAAAAARPSTARTTRASSCATACAASTSRGTAPTTTASSATSLSPAARPAPACPRPWAAARDPLHSALHSWSLFGRVGSLEKQTGICVHRAALKAEGLENWGVSCAVPADWPLFLLGEGGFGTLVLSLWLLFPI